MYSLTRFWIGLKRGEDADPGQRRREHHEDERQAVDADAGTGCRTAGSSRRVSTNWKPGRAGREGDEQARARRPRRRARRRAPTQRDGVRPARRARGRRAIAPSSGRKVTSDDEREVRETGHRGCRHDHEERAGHDQQADRDAQGVVLDAARLDPAQPAAGVPGRARRRRSRCRRRSSRSNHHRAAATRPPMPDEQQVVEVVEPPLVERGAVQERVTPVGGRDPLDHGRGRPPVRKKPNRTRCRRRGRCAAAATLTRISAPSMPASWNASAARPRIASDCANTGSSHCVSRPAARRRTAARAAARPGEDDAEDHRRDREQDQRHASSATATRGSWARRAGRRATAP